MYDLSKLVAIAATLGSFDKDCAITVALKIVDGSCKMNAYEKGVFLSLYNALPQQNSVFFDDTVFDVIEKGRLRPSTQVFAQIKPLREAAMDAITRPKMKAFKAQVRQHLAF